MSLQLLLPSPPPPLTINLRTPNFNGHHSRRALTINCKAKKDPIPTSSIAAATTTTLPQTVAIASGLISTPAIVWSLYTLQTTGSTGALEGLSYLATITIVGWSIYNKAKTVSGLPNGPFVLLGAVEGFSCLSLVAILLVFGLQFVGKSSLPGPLPSDQCIG